MALLFRWHLGSLILLPPFLTHWLPNPLGSFADPTYYTACWPATPPRWPVPTARRHHYTFHASISTCRHTSPDLPASSLPVVCGHSTFLSALLLCFRWFCFAFCSRPVSASSSHTSPNCFYLVLFTTKLLPIFKPLHVSLWVCKIFSCLFHQSPLCNIYFYGFT